VRPMQGNAAARSLDPLKTTTASECLSRPLDLLLGERHVIVASPPGPAPLARSPPAGV